MDVLPRQDQLSSSAECRRLGVLRDLEILDSAPERAFDDLSLMAARLCGTPYALVSLVDAERQWFKSQVGGGARQTSRDSSFCAHTLATGAMLIVPDTHLDPRFVDNPLVTGPPHYRFYAGAPLITSDGWVLGTLCVLDSVPRTLDATQLDSLTALARLVMSQIEIRRNNAALAQEVHARTAAEESLRSNRLLLDGILDHTDVLIFAKDADGRFLVANAALENAVGATPRGLTNTLSSLTFDPAQDEVYRRNDARIAESGRREVFEESLRHADGTTHLYRSTKFRLRDAQGTVVAVAGVSTDITELMSAQNALQQSEERWRALVEHSPVAVIVVGRDRRFRYANPAALALLSAADAPALVGRPAFEAIPADARPVIAELFDGLIAGGEAVHARRGKMTRLDGSVVRVEASAVAVTFAGAPAVQVEVRDVGAQLDAEFAVRSSAQRFRSLFDDSPVAMGLSDEHGLWVEVNPAFGGLLGVDPTELIGRSVTDFTHPDDHYLIAGSESGQRDSPTGIHRIEFRLRRPCGEIRWAWASITPTPGPKGQQWTLGVVQDITERKDAETSLRESEEDLAAIAEVARCVQSGADPRDLVVSSIRDLSGADAVSLFERLDRTSLVVTAVAGPEILGTALPLDRSSVARKVWRGGRSSFVPAVAAHIDDPGTESVLWQPVVAEGRVIALLRVTWKRVMVHPSERAVRAVRVLADEAGTALLAVLLRSELEKSATTDPLTEALNRRAWTALVEQALMVARADGGPLVVALIDLDHFKQYNDTFGHPAGDELLRDFVAAARTSIRAGDLFGRWGGEEFVLALPACSVLQARAILERVRAAVPDSRTCSIGFTVWDRSESIGETIERADLALYAAKDGGRNCIRMR